MLKRALKQSIKGVRQYFAPLKLSQNFCTVPKYEFEEKYLEGNEACAMVSYKMSDLTIAFPITPSAPMANISELWTTEKKENIWGKIPEIMQLQSEGGCIGAVEGALVTGGVPTTYSSSQGLMLMIPTFYIIAGKCLPFVIHVAARSLATNATNIGCDHTDVYAIRSTGLAMLCSRTPQECHDQALISHIASWKSSVPFCHFFDGHTTSHQVNLVKVIPDNLIHDWLEEIDYDEKLAEHRERGLNPIHPSRMGSSISTIYYPLQRAVYPFFEKLPGILEETMEEFYEKTGRNYELFNYHGCSDAEYLVISMGSKGKDIEETVDFLNRTEDSKFGCISVNLFRPWSASHFLEKIPKTIKKICVLDRTDEKGTFGPPLYLDVAATILDSGREIDVISGCYGVGGFRTYPSDIKAVFENLLNDSPKRRFILGPNDDECGNLAITYKGEPLRSILDKCHTALFYGVGGDGTIQSVRTAINLITGNTNNYAQGNNRHTAHKTLGITQSDLRWISKDETSHPISISFPVAENKADYLICNSKRYIGKLPMLDKLKKGGLFICAVPFDHENSFESISEMLPNSLKKSVAEKEATFYCVNAEKLDVECELLGYINMVMLSVFMSKSKIFTKEEVLKLIDEQIVKEFTKKGNLIIERNKKALRRSFDDDIVVKVDYPIDEWNKLIPETKKDIFSNDDKKSKDFAKNVFEMYDCGKEHLIKAKDLDPHGFSPPGTAKYERREVAISIPNWIEDNCIQCNTCSLLCPHGVIRTMVLAEEDCEGITAIPLSKSLFNSLEGDAINENAKFSIQVSAQNCTGCGVCTYNCPANALESVEFTKEIATQKQTEFQLAFKRNLTKDLKIKKRNGTTVPLLPINFEYNGACGGCAEASFFKIVTSMFGERMVIASATGCNTVYASYYPCNPFTTNQYGIGPSYARSLYENVAEFGYGMYTSMKQQRGFLYEKVEKYLENADATAEITEKLTNWKNDFEDGEKSVEYYLDMKDDLQKEGMEEINELKDFIIKPSQWIVGGDGWAYDIGFGGLDHVLSSTADVNVLVLDNELYANTGAQASKATPVGSYTALAMGGKTIKKKDLALQSIVHGHVYVATVVLGHNTNHLIKVLEEAESYKDGPSLIIALCPCREHKIRLGMNRTIMEKFAVQSGYFPLFKFDPRLKKEGKNPMKLVSKKMDLDKLDDFMGVQSRFKSPIVSKYATSEDENEKQLAQEHFDLRRELEAQLRIEIQERFDRIVALQESFEPVKEEK